MPFKDPEPMLIRDAKPQVGIFEIVDGVFLMDSEDTLENWSNGYFDGTVMHRHDQDIKTQVKYSPYVSEKTKEKFRSDPREYLRWQRGRVDYDPHEKKWHIMSTRDFLSQRQNVELVTRMFHLPPYSSGRIALEADEGHYGVIAD